MKRAIRTLGPLLLMAAAGVFAVESYASAQDLSKDPSPPAQCTAKPKHKEKFQKGFTTGKQKADQIFQAADVAKDKAKLRKKLNRVLGRLHDHIREAMADEASDGRRCRIQGVADGFIFRLAQLLGECVLDGAQWGQFAANLYCELSVELGGLAAQGEFCRAPVGLCGTLFENVCDNVYANVATEGATPISSGVKQFLAQRAVAITPYPGCAPYTRAPYDVVFSEAVNLDCAYDLP